MLRGYLHKVGMTRWVGDVSAFVFLLLCLAILFPFSRPIDGFIFCKKR